MTFGHSVLRLERDPVFFNEQIRIRIRQFQAGSATSVKSTFTGRIYKVCLQNNQEVLTKFNDIITTYKWARLLGHTVQS